MMKILYICRTVAKLKRSKNYGKCVGGLANDSEVSESVAEGWRVIPRLRKARRRAGERFRGFGKRGGELASDSEIAERAAEGWRVIPRLRKAWLRAGE